MAADDVRRCGSCGGRVTVEGGDGSDRPGQTLWYAPEVRADKGQPACPACGGKIAAAAKEEAP